MLKIGESMNFCVTESFSILMRVTGKNLLTFLVSLFEMKYFQK